MQWSICIYYGIKVVKGFAQELDDDKIDDSCHF